MCFYLEIAAALRSNSATLRDKFEESRGQDSNKYKSKGCVIMLTSRWRFRALSRPVVAITFFTGVEIV